MKKTLLMLSLVIVMLGLGVSQAYAVSVPPVTDGILGAGEWANLAHGGGPYPYYLEVGDPNEADNAFDNTDISHGVLLQELSLFGGTPGFGDDGIYLLVEVYAPPPTLSWDPAINVPLSGIGITGTPLITLQGDLLGDGLGDIFNVFLRHYNTNPDPVTGPGVDIVETCTGTAAFCLSKPLGDPAWPTLGSIGGTFGRGGVLEYFFPSGSLGTPPSPPGAPFPFSFIGKITYDNGLGGPNTSDDIVIGQLVIPEPSTMMLTATGLLSLLGFGKFKFWN